MSKTSKLRRQTVELRPSRIRRDPVREEKKVEVRSREREIWFGVAGIALFGIAIATVTMGFSVITAQDQGSEAAASNPEKFGSCDGGPNCVIDGETIRLAGATVKIAGMEAPRVQSAACPDEEQRGVKAAQRLADLLNSGEVTTGADVREPDGELRRTVLVGGRDVAATMVSEHLARLPQSEPQDWCS